MRNRLTNFLRLTTHAMQAKNLGEKKKERERRAKAGRGRGAAPAPVPAALVVDGVLIEYTPSMDGDPDPGEVVWAWVTYEEDPSQGKDRPVVVIGRRAKDSLVGVALTSKQDDRDPQVPVGTGPWDGQDRPSYAKIDRLVPLDPHAVRREGAVLERGRFDDVIEGLRRLHAG